MEIHVKKSGWTIQKNPDFFLKTMVVFCVQFHVFTETTECTNNEIERIKKENQLLKHESKLYVSACKKSQDCMNIPIWNVMILH